MTAAAIKGAIKSVLEGVAGTGSVYATGIYITDVGTLERYIVTGGLANATFIRRVGSNAIDLYDEPDGHLYARGYEEVYEVEILRAYEFEPAGDYEMSEIEIDRTYEAARMAFDTAAARDAFDAAGVAASSVTGASFGTIEYNAQGVLYSTVKFQITVRGNA